MAISITVNFFCLEAGSVAGYYPPTVSVRLVVYRVVCVLWLSLNESLAISQPSLDRALAFSQKTLIYLSFFLLSRRLAISRSSLGLISPVTGPHLAAAPRLSLGRTLGRISVVSQQTLGFSGLSRPV